MIEEQETVRITKGEPLGRIAAMRASGWRLVQISPTTLPDRYEMNYSFDKEMRLATLRFDLAPGESLPSISLIYESAFLYENEIHDLFGINVENMTVDYGGTLYRTAVPAPFSIERVAEATQARKAKAAKRRKGPEPEKEEEGAGVAPRLKEGAGG